jgi:hypothetical protein
MGPPVRAYTTALLWATNRELVLEASHVDGCRYGGELVDDHVRLGLAHHPAHGCGVQCIGHDRLGADAAELVALRLRAGHPDDLVPVGDQQGDQLLTQRTRGAGNENPHGDSLLFVYLRRQTREPACDSSALPG